jgi:hypothetical protein
MSRDNQIEEMAKILIDYKNKNHIMASTVILADYAEELYNAGYRKQEWISVEERLPEENEYVLIWVGNVQVARIEKGITEQDRQKMVNGEIEDRIEYGWSLSTGLMPLKRSRLYKGCDVQGNNRVPYCWKANGGPMEWFGQNVTHWMPLPEPPKIKGGE